MLMLFVLPCYVEAQDVGKIGDSKENIRLFLHSLKDKRVSVAESNDSDTINVSFGSMVYIMYYKDDTCNRIRITVPYVPKLMLEQKFINNSFKAVNEDEFANTQLKIKIDVYEDRRKGRDIIVENLIDK